MDNINHSDTPGEEGELAKDDVLGGPTENTIEDEVNQEGVEAGLGSIFLSISRHPACYRGVSSEHLHCGHLEREEHGAHC